MSEEKIELPYTLQLKKPVVVGSDTVSELVIHREPEMGDFDNMDLSALKSKDLMFILSKVTGQPKKTVIDKLTFRDGAKAMEVLNHFLVAAPETGAEN